MSSVIFRFSINLTNGKYLAQFLEHMGFLVLDEWYTVGKFFGWEEGNKFGKLGDTPTGPMQPIWRSFAIIPQSFCKDYYDQGSHLNIFSLKLKGTVAERIEKFICNSLFFRLVKSKFKS
jgi:hypothetical protein